MGEKASKGSPQSRSSNPIQKSINGSTTQLFNFGRKAASKAKEGSGKNKLTEGLESGPAEALNNANSIANSASYGLSGKLSTDKFTRDNPHNAPGDPDNNVDPGKNIVNANQAYNITGTLGGGFGVLYGIASGIDAFRNGGSISDKINAIFDIAASASGLASGITGIISDHTSGDTNTNATNASGGTWVAEGAINVVKNAYNTGKEIFYAFKRHNDEETGVASDSNERIDRTITILKGLMDTGAGIMKTINNAFKSFGGGSIPSEGIPILGLITSGFDIITRIIDIIRAGIQKLEIRQRMIELRGVQKPSMSLIPGKQSALDLAAAARGESTSKDYKNERKEVRKNKKKIFSSKKEQEHEMVLVDLFSHCKFGSL